MMPITCYSKDIPPLTGETCQEDMYHASAFTKLRGKGASTGYKCVAYLGPLDTHVEN